MRAGSVPKRCASASKKAMRGPMVSFGVTGKDFARQRRPRGFAAPTKVLAQLDQLSERDEASTRPATIKQRAARSEMVWRSSPKNEVFISLFSRPMMWSGNQVATPGTKHNITTARIMSPTKGITPHIHVAERDIRGDVLDDENIKPHRGVNKPHLHDDCHA